MCTSRTATDGWCSSIFSIASSPPAAVATTSHPQLRMRSLSVRMTEGWSSATTQVRSFALTSAAALIMAPADALVTCSSPS